MGSASGIDDCGSARRTGDCGRNEKAERNGTDGSVGGTSKDVKQVGRVGQVRAIVGQTCVKGE